MTLSIKNLNFKLLLSSRCHIGCASNYFSTTSTQVESVDPSLADEEPCFDPVEEIIPTDDLLQIRNKSGLKPMDRNMLFGRKPYDSPSTTHHERQVWQRKLFGRHGLQALDKPVEFLWPSEEQIEDAKEYERVAYPLSIQECWTKIEQEKQEKAAQMRARDEEVAAKMVNMDLQIKALHAKIAKKQAEVQAAKDRKQQLMEEVRSHFGFKIDFKDDRFKELLAQKEKEDKKKKKELKKQQKQEKFVAQMMKMHGDESSKQNDENKETPQEESNDRVEMRS